MKKGLLSFILQKLAFFSASSESAGWQLPDFDSAWGDDVEAGGGGAFVAGEEAVEGVILFDFALLDGQMDNRPAEPKIEFVGALRHFWVGGEDVELAVVGGFEHLLDRRIGREIDLRKGDGMIVAFAEIFRDRRSEVAV